jgi:uncharacterized protein
MTVVSNTTPLIALAEIGRLDLLRLLFGNLVIPPAVQREVQNPVARAALEQAANWITVQILKDVLAVRLLDETLDLGESEAIVLAQQLSATWLVVDEYTARRRAAQLGLRVVGTLGVLLMCKSHGLVKTVKPILDELRGNEFHIGDDLYHLVLKEAHETG